ncbi:MAG: hypothetical protein MI810_21855 [Flavobacteriales bacterium]|nr:hypothetical protein [Flavobacteriales bacterium]
MKNLVFIMAIALFAGLASCKKGKNNVFIQGRLMDKCGGSPQAGVTLYFYRNYDPGNWLTGDTPEELLETTTTDENGYFVFTGEDYIEKRASVGGSSIRMGDPSVGFTYLAHGILGDNEKAKDADGAFVNGDVGNLYTNGTSFSPIVKISETDADGTAYDSVKVSVNGCVDHCAMLTEVTDGNFVDTLNDVTAWIKYFSSSADSFHQKYEIIVSYTYYRFDYEFEPKVEYLHLEACSTEQKTFSF